MTDLIAAHPPLGALVHLLEPDDRDRAICGVRTHKNKAGRMIVVDATKPLGHTVGAVPLRWCPSCVGRLLEQHGVLDALALVLLGRTVTSMTQNPETTTTVTETTEVTEPATVEVPVETPAKDHDTVEVDAAAVDAAPDTEVKAFEVETKENPSA